MMRLSGLSVDRETLLLAGILDAVNFLAWAQTEDGQKNQNKPKSVLEQMTGERKKDEVLRFSSGAEFEAARAKLLGAISNGN